MLILQLGAYVSYLNLGVQTALSKYVAEYETRNDAEGCNQCASVGLAIMLVASLLGALLTGLLFILAPRLFNLPPALLHDVRVSLLLVGGSLSIGLSSSVFSAFFLGLQRYQIPMAITVTSRLLYAVVVCSAVGLHRGLIAMAGATAAVNLLTSIAEVVAWRRFAPFIRISLQYVTAAMFKRMAAYCSILTVWSACMLFISGLDVTIVAHYDFNKVAFYAIAGSPTNLILMVLGAIMGPLLPAASSLSVTHTPKQMGGLLLRSTRYSTILLLATGLPVLVGGYLLLHLWMGPLYATQSLLFLQVLLLANIVRNLCGPYATMVVATSRQGVATAAAITEGVLNLVCSILLARHLGAIGVALGTLIGAVAGVAMHFAISMHYTQQTFAIGRFRLLLGGLLVPGTMAIPSLLMVPFWWNAHARPAPPIAWAAWLASTLALAWFASLTTTDRDRLTQLAGRALRASRGV